MTRLFARGEPCPNGFAWRGAGAPGIRTAFESPGKLSRCARGSIRAGAGDETRTRDINLGKVALYQLSYTRAWEPKKIAGRLQTSMREFPVRLGRSPVRGQPGCLQSFPRKTTGPCGAVEPPFGSMEIARAAIRPTGCLAPKGTPFLSAETSPASRGCLASGVMIQS